MKADETASEREAPPPGGLPAGRGRAEPSGYASTSSRTGHGEPGRDPARFQRLVLARLTRDLSLTAAQQQQVEGILRETGQEFAKLRAEFQPQLAAIRTGSRDRIGALLNPDQQQKFDALVKRWERHREREGEGERGSPRAP